QHWIATGSPDTNIKMWDAQTGEARGKLKGHAWEVTALIFSPNGKHLFSGDNNGHIRVWKKGADDNGWEFERELVGHTAAITALRVTSDGSRLVSASGDHSCAQWDLSTGIENRQLVLKHSQYVSSIDISSDGTRALTSCEDGTVRLWRLADAVQLAAV